MKDTKEVLVVFCYAHVSSFISHACTTRLEYFYKPTIALTGGVLAYTMLGIEYQPDAIFKERRCGFSN